MLIKKYESSKRTKCERRERESRYEGRRDLKTLRANKTPSYVVTVKDIPIF